MWNDIRRTITTMLDLEIRKQRERVLNDLLWTGWERYTEGLKRGEVKELQVSYKAFAAEIVKDIVSAKVLSGEVADG